MAVECRRAQGSGLRGLAVCAWGHWGLISLRTAAQDPILCWG